MTTDVTGILRGTELLRSVPAEDLRALAAASRLRSFPRGQVLFTRDDPSDTVMVSAEMSPPECQWVPLSWTGADSVMGKGLGHVRIKGPGRAAAG